MTTSPPSTQPSAPQSPCLKICEVDAARDICTGCGRTLAEITEWGGATAQRQREILKQLPARMKAMNAR